MTPEVVFYSWQSDLDKKFNNFFVRDCAKAALKLLKKELKIEMSLDKDTQKTPGAPDIVETILKKIRAADIFICDVTIINNTRLTKFLKVRKTPNPNVLVELGYAIRSLGWERIICVVNTNYCKVDDLPFDIRKNRISTYYLKGNKGLSSAQTSLTDTLKTAFKQIIDDYDTILYESEKNDIILHDRALFEKFNNLITQSALEESMDFLVNNLRTTRFYYKLWDKIGKFAADHGNQFLNKEIQSLLEALSAAVNETKLFVATKLSPSRMPGAEYNVDYEERGVEITPELQDEIDHSQAFVYPDEPSDGDWVEFDKRRNEVIEKFIEHSGKLKAAFKDFRLVIKKHLMI